MKVTRALPLFALVLLVVVVATPQGQSKLSGREDLYYVGCGASTGCHGVPSQTLTITLEGLPDEYQPEKRYTLTLKLTGGPAFDNASGLGMGGFNLRATHGSFDASAYSPTLRYGDSNRELSHAANDTDARQWTFDWLAPEAGSGDVEFAVAALAGDGDGNATGDGWVTARFISSGSNFSWRAWLIQGVIIGLVAGGLLYLRHRLRKADLAQREALAREREEGQADEASPGEGLTLDPLDKPPAKDDQKKSL